jgi:hypothetical protein
VSIKSPCVSSHGYVLFQRSISIIQGVVAGSRYGLGVVAGWFARRGMLHVKLTNKLTLLAKCDIDLKAFGRSEFQHGTLPARLSTFANFA